MFLSKRFFSYLLIFPGVLLLFSCTNTDRKTEEGTASSPLFFHYEVSGDEELGFMTIKLQYLKDGEQGNPVSLDEQQVKFDGAFLTEQRTKRGGPYYEVSLPLDSFSGRHVVEFMYADDQPLRDEFEFSLFSLAAPIPDTVYRGNLEIPLKGLKDGARVHILLTDTSFYSKGIDRVDTVESGRVTLSGNDLKEVSNGPVQLELYQEEEQPVNKGKIHGGLLNFSYGIKRSFELRDSLKK